MAARVTGGQQAPNANGWVYENRWGVTRRGFYRCYAYQHEDGPTWFAASWGGKSDRNGPGGIFRHVSGVTAYKRRIHPPKHDPAVIAITLAAHAELSRLERRWWIDAMEYYQQHGNWDDASLHAHWEAHDRDEEIVVVWP